MSANWAKLEKWGHRNPQRWVGETFSAIASFVHSVDFTPNTNGLLEWSPKGRDLAPYSEEDLQTVTDELNDRPRNALDWDTPAERLSALLAAK